MTTGAETAIATTVPATAAILVERECLDTKPS
jgi:hypothetical protein